MLTAVGVRDPGSREDQHHLVVGMAVVRGTTGGYLADELGGDGAALARPEQDAESPVAGHFGCTVRELTYHWCRWIGGAGGLTGGAGRLTGDRRRQRDQIEPQRSGPGCAHPVLRAGRQQHALIRAERQVGAAPA